MMKAVLGCALLSTVTLISGCVAPKLDTLINKPVSSLESVSAGVQAEQYPAEQNCKIYIGRFNYKNVEALACGEQQTIQSVAYVDQFLERKDAIVAYNSLQAKEVKSGKMIRHETDECSGGQEQCYMSTEFRDQSTIMLDTRYGVYQLYSEWAVAPGVELAMVTAKENNAS